MENQKSQLHDNNRNFLTTSGVLELDRLLGGGIKIGSSTLLLTDSSTYNDAIVSLLPYCRDVLQRGEILIYILTSSPAIDERDLLNSYCDVELVDQRDNEGKLFFVDLFSRSAGYGSEISSNAHVIVEKPHDVNFIYNRLCDLRYKILGGKKSKARFIYNDLSATIIDTNNHDQAIKLMRRLLIQLKALGDLIHCILNEKMHDEKITETIKHLFDNVIQFKSHEQKAKPKKFLQVTKSINLFTSVNDMVPYEVTRSGISVRLKKEKERYPRQVR